MGFLHNFHLSSQNKDDIFQSLNDLRKQKILTDVVLSCEGQFYPAHKLVLTLFSSYFSEAFKEMTQANPVFFMCEMKKEILQEILSLMYCGQVSIHLKKIGDFLKATALLGISILKEKSLNEKEQARVSDNEKTKAHISRNDLTLSSLLQNREICLSKISSNKDSKIKIAENAKDSNTNIMENAKVSKKNITENAKESKNHITEYDKDSKNNITENAKDKKRNITENATNNILEETEQVNNFNIVLKNQKVTKNILKNHKLKKMKFRNGLERNRIRTRRTGKQKVSSPCKTILPRIQTFKSKQAKTDDFDVNIKRQSDAQESVPDICDNRNTDAEREINVLEHPLPRTTRKIKRKTFDDEIIYMTDRKLKNISGRIRSKEKQKRELSDDKIMKVNDRSFANVSGRIRGKGKRKREIADINKISSTNGGVYKRSKFLSEEFEKMFSTNISSDGEFEGFEKDITKKYHLFECFSCNEKFLSFENLVEHFKCMHENLIDQHMCINCHRIFHYPKSLENHITGKVTGRSTCRYRGGASNIEKTILKKKTRNLKSIQINNTSRKNNGTVNYTEKELHDALKKVTLDMEDLSPQNHSQFQPLDECVKKISIKLTRLKFPHQNDDNYSPLHDERESIGYSEISQENSNTRPTSEIEQIFFDDEENITSNDLDNFSEIEHNPLEDISDSPASYSLLQCTENYLNSPDLNRTNVNMTENEITAGTSSLNVTAEERGNIFVFNRDMKIKSGKLNSLRNSIFNSPAVKKFMELENMVDSSNFEEYYDSSGIPSHFEDSNIKSVEDNTTFSDILQPPIAKKISSEGKEIILSKFKIKQTKKVKKSRKNLSKQVKITQLPIKNLESAGDDCQVLNKSPILKPISDSQEKSSSVITKQEEIDTRSKDINEKAPVLKPNCDSLEKFSSAIAEQTQLHVQSKDDEKFPDLNQNSDLLEKSSAGITKQAQLNIRSTDVDKKSSVLKRNSDSLEKSNSAITEQAQLNIRSTDVNEKFPVLKQNSDSLEKSSSDVTEQCQMNVRSTDVNETFIVLKPITDSLIKSSSDITEQVQLNIQSTDVSEETLESPSI